MGGKKLFKALSFFLTAGLCFAVNISYAQTHGDSVKLAIEPSYNNVSGTHQFFLGDNYRKLWAAPVTLPVFHLAAEKGGA
ncbi:hypothetical protein [Mucilaginibacter sp.]|uniref:hypothetical protein n=1 Tax=Mucilaginibacter sp. TaxID=1882438 RepID=UPI002ED2E95A